MKFLYIFLFLTTTLFSANAQTKNFLDQPYIETSARVDTLVTPNKIYLKIIISEKDSRGKISVEELDKLLFTKLISNDVDVKTQLTLNEVASNYKKYFLKSQDIVKTKSYTLVLFDAATTGKILGELEEIGIANVSLDRTEYTKIDELKSILRRNAVLKAKRQATELARPLNRKVGDPIYISDGSSFSLEMLSGRVAGINIRSRKSLGYAVKANIEGSDIEFQKVSASLDVNLIFKLE